MLDNEDLYFCAKNEVGDIQKLEDIFQTAKIIIDSMPTNELPVAFRMAFNLLERTGKIICLSKMRSKSNENKCYIFDKRRHSSCSYKIYKNDSNDYNSLPENSDGYRYNIVDSADVKNFFADPIQHTEKNIYPEDQRSGEFINNQFPHSIDETNECYETASQGSEKVHKDAHVSTTYIVSNSEEPPPRFRYYGDLRQQLDPGKRTPQIAAAKRYPHCSSAPIPSMVPRSPTNKPGFNFLALKERRRNAYLVGSRNASKVETNGASFDRSEIDFTKKRLNQALNLNRNWKISHSDRLNTLIDECERIIDGRKVFKCKFCGKMYDIKSSMRYHMKIIHLQLHLHTSEMQCRICGKQFTCISAVNRHQLKCSANSISSYINSQPIQSTCNTVSQSDFYQAKRQSVFSRNCAAQTLTGQNPVCTIPNSLQGMRWIVGHSQAPIVPTSLREKSAEELNYPMSGVSSREVVLPNLFPQLSSNSTSVSSRADFNVLMNQANDVLQFDHLNYPSIDSQSAFKDPFFQKFCRAPLNHSVENLVEGETQNAFNVAFSKETVKGITGEKSMPHLHHHSPDDCRSMNQIRKSRVNESVYTDAGSTQISDYYFKQMLKNQTDTAAIDLSLNASLAC